MKNSHFNQICQSWMIWRNVLIYAGSWSVERGFLQKLGVVQISPLQYCPNSIALFKAWTTYFTAQGYNKLYAFSRFQPNLLNLKSMITSHFFHKKCYEIHIRSTHIHMSTQDITDSIQRHFYIVLSSSSRFQSTNQIYWCN